jgi:hypothetical protein
MILVTGGTGFIGHVLVRHLVNNGHEVRLLLRPSPRTPNLPAGIPVEVAVTSLYDERGLMAAAVGLTWKKSISMEPEPWRRWLRMPELGVYFMSATWVQTGLRLSRC